MRCVCGEKKMVQKVKNGDYFCYRCGEILNSIKERVNYEKSNV